MPKIKPCKYCDFDKYEQSSAANNIVRPNVFAKKLGKLQFGEVSVDGQMYRKADGRCYIDVWLNAGSFAGGDIAEINIKYCPMCGRKLIGK